METIKTAVIVVLLMAVLYGVYVVLNKPQTPPSEEIAWHEQQAMEPLQIDYGADSAGLPAMPAGTTDNSLGFDPLAGVGADVPPGTTTPAPPSFAGPSSATGHNFGAGQFATATPPSTAAEETSLVNPPSAGASMPSPATSDYAEASPNQLPDAATRLPNSEEESNFDPSATFQIPSNSLAAEPASSAPPTEESLAVEERAEQLSMSASAFQRAVQAASAKIDESQWYEALFTLSLQYDNDDLGPDERAELLSLLDPLAGKVIYSKEPLVEPHYEVQRGDTLLNIADSYHVPWQLLANINGIEDPQVLVPGTKIKVVPGPFRAEVDLQGQELTLFIGRLYAGRFAITIGGDPLPQPGEYTVNDKQTGRTYYAGDGRTIPAGDPNNPYGKIWLDLGGDVCIHGSAMTGEPGAGCISLSPIDANDVFGILSKGSSILIRR